MESSNCKDWGVIYKDVAPPTRGVCMICNKVHHIGIYYCLICKDTGIDESDPDYHVACNCPQGRKAHDHHTNPSRYA